MPKLVVVSHNLRSDALKNLANKLSELVGYKVWRKYPNAVLPRHHPVTFMGGIDKVKQFQAFAAAHVSCPCFATTLAEAQQLASKSIVVRALIDSSEGRGITICEKESLTQEAPLYTEYIPKKKEYRVHVLDNKVIDTQEKRKKRGAEQKEHQVRNLANGYVFCRDSIAPPDDCHTVALAAVSALGRTYGAVDIIWNEKRNKCYVLEVNSRPGMEGTTVDKYAQAIVEGLPEDVRHPPVHARVLPVRAVRQVRADGRRLITTRKGNKVWR